MKMIELFEAARRVSVPLLAIRTADQNATIAEIAKSSDPAPLIQWDAARGVTAANKPGADLVKKYVKESQIGFVDMMLLVEKFPEYTIVFVHNAMRQLHSQEPIGAAANVQAVANLRDELKKNWRTLVLLGPVFIAPPEMEQDVVVLDHALPDQGQLEVIISELHDSAKLPKPEKGILAKAADAVSGLSSFSAEQVAAMSLTKDGIDLGALWERKRVAIEQTPGMSVHRGTERFADLIGLSAIKENLLEAIHGKTPVGVCVWVDEIDKTLANVEQDTSGVRMDQLKMLLTEMENNEWQGSVAVGVPGGGKSAISKAFGNEAGVPVIALDLGGMESKYVGESEANLRRALQVIKAIGRGHAYFIATSNNASVMRPELQRRFTDGFWFFDMMSAEERAACWSFYQKKYELKKQERPSDDGWTGAEIRNCCRKAWNSGKALVEASKFILPMAQSRVEDIELMRIRAHGRYLDASKPGSYVYEPATMVKMARAITIPGQSTAVN